MSFFNSTSFTFTVSKRFCENDVDRSAMHAGTYLALEYELPTEQSTVAKHCADLLYHSNTKESNVLRLQLKPVTLSRTSGGLFVSFNNIENLFHQQLKYR